MKKSDCPDPNSGDCEVAANDSLAVPGIRWPDLGSAGERVASPVFQTENITATDPAVMLAVTSDAHSNTQRQRTTTTSLLNTLQLGTFGQVFEFHLQYMASANSVDVVDAEKRVILSDSKAFNLYKTRDLYIGFLMLATDLSIVEVKSSTALRVGAWYSISVSKTKEQLCLKYNLLGKPSYPTNCCVQTDSIMKPVGELSYGDPKFGTAKNFAQTFSLSQMFTADG